MASEAKTGFKLTPVWLLTIVFCGLLIYIVVKKVDDISEVKVEGTGGIVFHGSAAPLPPSEQHERSREIEARIETYVRNASTSQPPRDPTPELDLSGMWMTVDGTATWMVLRENGLFVFRESTMAMPGIIATVGYGQLDGRTWSLQFQSIIGISGTASLHLQDDGTLSGEAIPVGGRNFPLMLRRSS